MIVVHELGELRSRVESWRRGGNVAFVPTMGNLHAGHLSLVKEARVEADRVVASIFRLPTLAKQVKRLTAKVEKLEAAKDHTGRG